MDAILKSTNGGNWMAQTIDFRSEDPHSVLNLGISKATVANHAQRGQSWSIGQLLGIAATGLINVEHIPNVNSRESTQRGKTTEVGEIMGALGEWIAKDEATGFDLVRRSDGRVLRIADLVDDGPDRHARVLTALKDASQKNNRDHVDIIIALGMAKEGFDWIWCEHALTVGYRSSLTEIVQIIGRATRDAPGKTRTRFTNLIAEPDASEGAVTEAVNDTLKAIAASLLMEQVLAPRFEFKPKTPASGPVDDFEYGPGGYDPDNCNVGFNEERAVFRIEIKGLAEPKSKEAVRICNEDLTEVVAAFVQDKPSIEPSIERGLFDEELVPEELTQLRMGKIVRAKFPELDADDQEAVRQHAIAALNITQQAKKIALGDAGTNAKANTALIDGVRRFVTDVTQLDIDMIDRINPFGEAYAILSKSMNEDRLKQVEAAITAKRTKLTPEDAKELAGNARKDATYLLANVDVVAEYKLYDINRTKLEKLIHRFFADAAYEIEITDRFGNPVKPREWFLAPLQAIDEAVQRIRDGSISQYRYDPKQAALVKD